MEPSSRLWNPEGGEAEWLRLIDFINPKSKAIKGVIAQAKDKAPNGEFPAYVAQEGEDDAELVSAQVEAIYETLRERRIGYAVERWDSRPPAQIIRLHEEVLDAKGIGGPCIDLVVLMAACLEAVGIQPLIIVLEEQYSGKRHAILGYRLEELLYGPETPANEIPPLLGKQELDRLKNTGLMEFINCTGITCGENVKFEEAQNQGRGYVESSEPDKRDRYKEHWQVVFALDVKVTRHTALTREMLKYFKQVRTDALTLPPAFGFPPGRNFPEIRVQVKVRKGQRRYSKAEARAREMSRRQMYANEESKTKAYQYPRPSPEEVERESERPLDWDREVRQRLKRAVILGDPGFGKTWLLKHEALELAKEAIDKLKKRPLATDEIQLPMFLPLVQLAAQADEQGRGLPMEEALLAALVERYPVGGELEQWIKENLNSEQCVLLLDALDEVPSDRKEDLCERLAEFARKHDQTPILLTSRLVGYPGPPFPLPPDGELELLPFDRRQQREFVRKWFEGQGEKAEAFLRGLRESPQLQALAGVPLLLALMCRLLAGRGELPKSRAELYAGCLCGILTRRWKTPRSGDDPYLDAKLELLEETAFQLFVEEKELFSLRDLRTVIEKILEAQSSLARDLGRKAAAELVRELEDNGLLIKAGVGDNLPYLFLHLTFQEYLAACALARRTSLVDLNGQEVPEWLAIVKPHLFDPRWEEVILLLASQLEDATPLVQAIWQEPEDLFLGRLLLATKCLVDAGYIQDRLSEEVIQEILTLMEAYIQGPQESLCSRRKKLARLPAFIESFLTAGRSSSLSPLDALHLSSETYLSFVNSAGMLAAVNGRVFQELVSRLEREPHSSSKEILVRALGATRSERAVPLLRSLLRDRKLRRVAEEALEKLSELTAEGQESARERLKRTETIASLVERLKSPDPKVVADTANALLDIRSKEEIRHLIKLLDDRDSLGETLFAGALLLTEVRHVAAWVLGRIKSNEAVPTLERLLKDPDSLMRRVVAQALGQIGDNSVVPSLIELYRDPDPYVCGEVVVALGRIKEAEPHLIELLDSPDPNVRKRATESLGWIGGERVIMHLLRMLEDPHPEVRVRATTALGRVVVTSREIRDKRIIAAIMALLRKPENLAQESAFYTKRRGVWKWAVRTLGRIGSEEAVPALIRLLANPNPEVRLEVVRALGNIGSKRATPVLIKLLKELPRDRRPDIKRISLRSPFDLSAVDREVFGHPAIRYLRQATPWALGRIGDERAIQALYEFALQPAYTDYEAREAASRALKAISQKQGIRILLDGSCLKVR